MKFFATLILLFLHFNFLGQATARFTASVTIINPNSSTLPEAVKFSRINTVNSVSLTKEQRRIKQNSKEINVETIALRKIASFQLDGESTGNFRVNLLKGEHLLRNGNSFLRVIDFSSSQSNPEIFNENQNILDISASVLVGKHQETGLYKSFRSLEIIVDYE